MRLVSIYKLHDPREPDHVRYVGQTCGLLLDRLYGHIGKSRSGARNYAANWIRSLLAVGIRPEITLLEVVREANRQSAEKYWIAELSKYNKLVNSTAGGDGAPFPSPEVRMKMSLARKGKDTWNKGKPASEEAKLNMRAASKGKKSPMEGKKFSDESKLKMRLSHLGQTSGMKGKTHSQESRAKISASKMGKPSPRKGVTLSQETRDKIKAGLIGRHPSDETRAKLTAAMHARYANRSHEQTEQYKATCRAIWAKRKEAKRNILEDGVWHP